MVVLTVCGLIGGSAIGLGINHAMGVDWFSRPADKVASPASSLCIADVHDGDTIRTCSGERVRIENIDAPELPDSPKCTDPQRRGWCDYQLARQSRDELASFLDGGAVVIFRSGTDRYGRTLATLTVNGVDAGNHLVSMGLARPWL